MWTMQTDKLTEYSGPIHKMFVIENGYNSFGSLRATREQAVTKHWCVYLMHIQRLSTACIFVKNSMLLYSFLIFLHFNPCLFAKARHRSSTRHRLQRRKKKEKRREEVSLKQKKVSLFAAWLNFSSFLSFCLSFYFFFPSPPPLPSFLVPWTGLADF